MRALLRKDIYTLAKQMRWVLFLLLLWGVWPNNAFMNSFAIVYMSMMPYSSIAYDERSKWDQLACMMPYSMEHIVLSKYVLGWVLVGFAAILSGPTQLLLSMIRPELWAFVPEILLSNICLAVIALAISLPPVFYFGAERGRILRTFVLIILFSGVGISAVIVDDFADSLTSGLSFTMAQTVFTLALPLVALICTGVSVPLSVYLYRLRLKSGI